MEVSTTSLGSIEFDVADYLEHGKKSSEQLTFDIEGQLDGKPITWRITIQLQLLITDHEVAEAQCCEQPLALTLTLTLIGGTGLRAASDSSANLETSQRARYSTRCDTIDHRKQDDG